MFRARVSPVWFLVCCAAAMSAPATAQAQVVDSLVTAAAPTDGYLQNASDEPAMAVDASRPNVLAIGAHELMDQQRCSRAAVTSLGSCTFPINGLTTNAGVGITGIYFSFDSGRSWTQPTYQGLTAAACDPTVEPCVGACLGRGSRAGVAAAPLLTTATGGRTVAAGDHTPRYGRRAVGRCSQSSGHGGRAREASYAHPALRFAVP
jgi:hypothetical protein